MPRDFQYVRPYDLFTSMGPVAGTPNLIDRGNHSGFYALGRLKPGVSLEAAGSELKAIAAALEREYPNTNSARRRPRRAARRSAGRRHPSHAARAARRRRFPAADCLRQRREPADRARRLAAARARRPRRARRRTRAAGEPDAGREHPGVGGRRRARHRRRRVAAARPGGGRPRGDAADRRGAPRRDGAAVRARRRGDLRRRVRRAAGVPGVRRAGSAGAGARPIGRICLALPPAAPRADGRGDRPRAGAAHRRRADDAHAAGVDAGRDRASDRIIC